MSYSKQENSEVATYSVTNTIKKEVNNQKNIVQENNNQVVEEVNTAIVKQNEIENNNKDSAINKEIPQEKVLVEENTAPTEEYKINEKKIAEIRNIINSNPSEDMKCYGYEIVVEEKGKSPVTMTIGEFWDSASKDVSKIIDRFKGVGEINAEDVFKASLDINNRISVQYTMEDVEKELEIFNIVHGPLKKDVEKRKKMMKEYSEYMTKYTETMQAFSECEDEI